MRKKAGRVVSVDYIPADCCVSVCVCSFVFKHNLFISVRVGVGDGCVCE